MELKNTVIYLIGFPGIGKYTIAKEMAQKADFVIVDNQLMNNPIFSLVKADGVRQLDHRVWGYIHRVRDVVFDAILNLTPLEQNFVFTNVLTENPKDRAVYNRVEELAKERSSHFFPILLTCDLAAHKMRIISADRKERMKDVNPLTPEQYHAKQDLIRVTHPHILSVDVSSNSASDAAAIILSHIEKVVLHQNSCALLNP